MNEKALAFLNLLFGYAVANTYLDTNPAEKIRALAAGSEQLAGPSRVAYEPEDFRRILSSPLFTCGATEDGIQKNQDSILKRLSVDRLKDYQWIVLLAMYTGARLEEIGQLDLEDVLTPESSSGLPCISIHADVATGRRIKNAGSRRIIPIHPRLVDLGFLRFVEERRREAAQREQTQGGAKLFRSLESKRDKLTSAFSSWWGRYGKRFGFYAKDKQFHSFRHAFKRMMRDANANSEHVDDMQGHAGMRGASSGYGKDSATGLHFSIATLAKTLERLNFDPICHEQLESFKALNQRTNKADLP